VSKAESSIKSLLKERDITTIELSLAEYKDSHDIEKVAMAIESKDIQLHKTMSLWECTLKSCSNGFKLTGGSNRIQDAKRAFKKSLENYLDQFKFDEIVIIDQKMTQAIAQKQHSFEVLGVRLTIRADKVTIKGTSEALEEAQQLINEIETSLTKFQVHEISKPLPDRVMRRLQVFFREKHGIELEQRAGDLTEIVMKDCQDVKVKVQLMKMLSAF